MIKMTIIDFLKDRATRNADDLAFRFMGNGELDGPITKWTFSELYHQSAGVAEDLVEQGLAGSSVLLAFPPGLDFVKAFFGCLLAGARAVPVPLPNPNSKNPLGRILRTAEACGASTVLTNQQLAAIAATMGSELPVCLRAVTDRVTTDWAGPRAEMNQVAYLQFTSGSTGHPKGVAVSHANAVSNLRVMGQMLRLRSTKPAMVWAPHYHDLCLIGHVLGPVHYGYESTLMSPMEFLLKPVRWLRAMSHYKIANTACPNFGYEYSARRIKTEDCEGLDLSHWIVAGNGGEPVLQQTMEVFIKKFGPYGFRPQTFMPTYGMAESVLFVAGLKPLSQPPKVLTLSATDLEMHTVRVLDDNKPGDRKAVSCGSPGYGHRVIAVDPVTLTKSNPNKVGELWVQGPSVPSGYWGLPEESAATFEWRLADTNEGPFLRTGDLGFVADGEIYVTGRLKDMIIIAGRNHYASDIELTVQRSGAPVRLGACVAISEHINGVEELVIVAEVDERRLPANAQPESPGAESLSEFWTSAAKTVRGAVSEEHGLSVRSVVFVEPRSLEKTTSGKPRRQHYQKLFLKEELAVLHGKRSPQTV
ncbi:MAG: fatty acyl-AMP ligase [Deltaproteobacteria bacterium]|nr:fatty acyl-AMP ligase [Deltaproteobacteria bacterium]